MSSTVRKEEELIFATDLCELLDRRIAENYGRLYRDGRFPKAAFEAMKQAELVLREKTVASRKL